MERKKINKSVHGILCVFLLFSQARLIAQDIPHVFEKNQSFTYSELISNYSVLDKKYKQAVLVKYNSSDAGKPIHLFLIGKTNNPVKELEDGKLHLLINNGIHPGEPDGMDASLFFAEKILKSGIPDHLVIGIIPVYNVDGMLNRSCCSRANQNGPEEYGFRGNSRNLDLNRDFIKADSDNAKVFAEIFHFFNPHVLVDTHVSNGADYQYTMTLLVTQSDKLGLAGKFLRSVLTADLYSEMSKKNYPMIPYVNTHGETPESGIVDFYESPRFATGYAALFGVLGFTTETHMFKPFPDRVKSTIAFLEALAPLCEKNYLEIIRLKEEHNQFAKNTKKMKHPLNWVNDTTVFTEIEFKGFEAIHEPSEVTGKTRLRYDRTRPWAKKIRYYNQYVGQDFVEVPKAYILPQAWDEVWDRLKLNNVKSSKIKNDTVLEVESYIIMNYQTVKNPYEGHYLHYNTKVKSERRKIHFHEGDRIIKTDQSSWRYIVETLEPQAIDSYFNWNFFDAVVQQKEWFSDYVFEDYAKDFLDKNPKVKDEFELLKKENAVFAGSVWEQLYFIYRKSPYYEPSHNLYPVFRMI